jgi:hypothetical protein
LRFQNLRSAPQKQPVAKYAKSDMAIFFQGL